MHTYGEARFTECDSLQKNVWLLNVNLFLHLLEDPVVIWMNTCCKLITKYDVLESIR